MTASTGESRTAPIAAPTLADVLPAIVAAMGIRTSPDASAAPSTVALPGASRACLLLVDGLGLEILSASNRGDAPFLSSRLPGAAAVRTGFPSSTPISLCSVTTGRLAGEHGVVGFTMHVPPTPFVMECLSWRRYDGTESALELQPPEAIQPITPLFGAIAAAGAMAAVVSVAEHVGTGLTRAAFRGADLRPISRFEDWPARRARINEAFGSRDRALVYTYDARLDTAAHQFGVGSSEWRAALRATDRLAADLAGQLPADGMLVVTGDHGARTIPSAEHVDLAERPDLAAGVAFLSGDPRARHVHAAPGRAAAVLEAWRTGLDPSWRVADRDAAIAAGWFGPVVRDAIRPRIGDVVAAATDGGAVFDTRHFPWERRLVSFHGGFSADEAVVPLVVEVR